MATQQKTVQRPVRQPQRTQPQRPAQRPQQRTRSTRGEAKGMVRPFEMPFETKNLVIIIAGILTVGLGYLIMGMSPTMSTGALTIAPIILVLGYCVIIPYGIMFGARAYIKEKRQAAVMSSDDPVSTL